MDQPTPASSHASGTAAPADPLLWLNGEIVEPAAARISPFDRGFLWGDGVYEVTPLFGETLYRLDDHLDRLYRSLRYVRIDPGMTKEALREATHALIAANAQAGRFDGAPMHRVGHWVTRGVDSPSMAARDSGPATVMIFARPVDAAAIERNREQGIVLSVSATRRNHPSAIETRAKVTSKINQVLAELDSGVHGAQPLMLDLDGNVAEHATANVFIVRDGELWTPPERNILEGVTRKAVFELAAELGIALHERLFTLYDIAQAEEVFITSSAVLAMPVRAVDGFVPTAPVPGPVTRRLMEGFEAALSD